MGDEMCLVALPWMLLPAAEQGPSQNAQGLLYVLQLAQLLPLVTRVPGHTGISPASSMVKQRQ